MFGQAAIVDPRDKIQQKASITSTTITTTSSSGLPIASIGLSGTPNTASTTNEATSLITNTAVTEASDETFTGSFNKWILTLQEVFNNKEAALLLSAATIRFCAGFTIGIWKAPFVFAKFPNEIAEFAGMYTLNIVYVYVCVYLCICMLCIFIYICIDVEFVYELLIYTRIFSTN